MGCAKLKIYNTIIRLIFLIGLAILMDSCIESYDFESKDFESVLIVEATITDKLKKQEIKLSRSYNLKSDTIKYESEAIVKIIDSNNNIYNFIEADNGIYVSETQFKALEGTNYHLNITTQDGEEYVSTEETIVGSSGLGSLSLEKLNVDGVEEVTIFAKTDIIDNDPVFLRYTYQETSKIVSPYSAQDNKRLIINQEGNIVLKRSDRERQICYKTEDSKKSILTNTSINKNNLKTAIRSFDKLDVKIYFGYSILVKQMVISRESYNYYKTLNDISGQSNVFSQNQPGFIYGNISSINRSSSKVLGYFEVAKISSKRVFLNYSDFFSESERVDLKNRCNTIIPFDSELQDIIKEGNYEYLKDSPPLLWSSGRLYELVNKACIDCNEIGTNVKPDFWID